MKLKYKVAWAGSVTVEDAIDSVPDPVLVIYGNGPGSAYGPVAPDQIETVLRDKCENFVTYDFSYHAQGRVVARDRGFCLPNRRPITELYENTKHLVAAGRLEVIR